MKNKTIILKILIIKKKQNYKRIGNEWKYILLQWKTLIETYSKVDIMGIAEGEIKIMVLVARLQIQLEISMKVLVKDLNS